MTFPIQPHQNFLSRRIEELGPMEPHYCVDAVEGILAHKEEKHIVFLITDQWGNGDVRFEGRWFLLEKITRLAAEKKLDFHPKASEMHRVRKIGQIHFFELDYTNDPTTNRRLNEMAFKLYRHLFMKLDAAAPKKPSKLLQIVTFGLLKAKN